MSPIVPPVTPSELLPGDVLLYRPLTPSLVDRQISKATGSPFTHAAIALGDGTVAESVWPLGVRTASVQTSLRGRSYAAVMRSQMGFGGSRTTKLSTFVSDVEGKRKFYNLFSVIGFERRSKRYFETQMEFIRDNYGIAKSAAEFSRESFFCSAFVVACFAVVGIIGETAQSAYQPDSFSPGHLALDPTFGWLLGYLISDGCSVPEDDPLLVTATQWRDHPGPHWWTSA
jgi:hypothetical protein